MAAEVVGDDDVAGTQRGHQNLLYVNEEQIAVDGRIDEPGRFDPIMAQSCDEGHRVPVSIRHLGEHSDANRSPTAQRCHVGLGPGLVDEHQAGRINQFLIMPPLQAAPRDVGAILFACEYRFFYR